MSCKARLALKNECVGRLLPQCRLPAAGAVEQDFVLYTITKSFGAGKAMRRNRRSTKKSMVHSAGCRQSALGALLQNDEFSRAGAQTSTNYFKQAAARSSIAQPTDAGVHEARTHARQLGDKSDTDIGKTRYRQGSRWASAIEGPCTRQAQNLRILLHLW